MRLLNLFTLASARLLFGSLGIVVAAAVGGMQPAASGRG